MVSKRYLQCFQMLRDRITGQALLIEIDQVELSELSSLSRWAEEQP